MKKLNLNLDFTQPVYLHFDAQEWVESYATGVSRTALEKEAAESGHTTSFVIYKPGASFPEHVHPNGEEIIVMEGVFSDENGDYPKGTYLRNPPGSRHSPFSKDGCKLFVKLEQFMAGDDKQVTCRPENRAWQEGRGNLRVLPLHAFDVEQTALVYWPKNETFIEHYHHGGEEIVVLIGEFCDESGRYAEGSWLRNPHLSKHTPYTEKETMILVKTGHLPN